MAIPVTLITGFLGAGKTTLVARLLHGDETKINDLIGGDRGGEDASSGENSAKERIALIQNEFLAEVGVENELLGADESSGGGDAARESVVSNKDSAGDWVVELFEFGGGCLCCSASGDLQRILRELLAPAASQSPEISLPDRIIIETTGLAVPGPVARALSAFSDTAAAGQESMASGANGPKLVLDGIVTVVDCAHFLAALRDQHKQPGSGQRADVRNEAYDQLLCADVVILNKQDLVSSADFEAVRAEVARINPAAKLVGAMHGGVDRSVVLGLGGGLQLWRKLSAQEQRADDALTGIPHDEGLFPVLLLRDEPLPSVDAVRDWLSTVCAESLARGGFVRVKGLLFVAGSGLFVLQGVGTQLAITTKDGLSDTTGGASSRIVLFAYGADTRELNRQFASL
jgi:cobalamin biosynthesis protein CobW